MTRPGVSGRPSPGYDPRRHVRRWLGPLFAGACLLATCAAAGALLLLLGSVVYAVMGGAAGQAAEGAIASLGELTAFFRRLARCPQASEPSEAGFAVGLAGSLWLLALVALLAVPVGVGAAVYLEEYVPPGRLKRWAQTNIANLAGVPSIVYGILGLAVFVRAFGLKAIALGPTLLAGALTLGLLILPIIIVATQESLRVVPRSLREAALALGATRWQVVRDHVLPSALPGIMTGAILGVSRAIGETAPLLLVGAAGSILRPPRGPLDRYSALPVEIYNYARQPGPGFQQVAAGGILVLIALLLAMNAAAIVIRNRVRRTP